MSSAWALAAIQEFEQVTLESDTELFRVRARMPVSDDPGPRPVLATHGPDGVRTYEPLSSGGDRRGLLRLAYAVPTHLVKPSTTFALQLPDGDRIDLPPPTPGPRRSEARTDRGVQAAPARTREPIPATTAEPAADHAARTDELEQELTQLRQRLEHLTGEHDGELQASRADAGRVQHDLEAERDAAREHATSLIAERDEAREHAEVARSQREAAHGDLRAAQSERDAAREHAEAVRVERDEALRGAGSAQAERDATRLQVESVQAERDAALHEARAARSERDAALAHATAAQGERDAALASVSAAAEAAAAATADRDSVLGTTAEARAEHARLLSRLRQRDARVELLRVDAQRSQSFGTSARQRQLEAEREQLTGHVRALAELLSVNGRPDAADRRNAAARGTRERIAAMRDRAVRAAHEQAERDLERVLSDAAR